MHPLAGSAEELAAFAALQQTLPAAAEAFFAEHDGDHAVVIVPSLSVDAELLTALHGAGHYEERLLALLLLLRRPRTRVVFVTSSPVSSTVVDYYLHLVTGVPSSHARRRLTMVSCDDTSPRPLSLKLLERPARLDEIRRAVAGAATAGLVVAVASPLERTLAVQLGLPLYGNDPALDALGTKSGSRDAFRAAGIDLPDGCECLHGPDEVATALAELKGRNPTLARAVVKLEEGFSGDGNAIFRYDGVDATDDAGRTAQIRRLLPERLEMVAATESWERYAEQLSTMGGIVEAFVEGDDKTSPSGQALIDPLGLVHPMSTHDQLLGGPGGQVYEGSTFPADPAYRLTVQEATLAVGEELARRGARGRFAVDFVTARDDEGLRCFAIEVNLRDGGTTHPMMVLEALTNGRYDRATGEYLSRSGRSMHYWATDGLEDDRYRGLSADDLVDLAVTHHLHYDPTVERGVVFHMLGALSEFGKVGVTCIGRSADEATGYAERVRTVLDEATTAP